MATLTASEQKQGSSHQRRINNVVVERISVRDRGGKTKCGEKKCEKVADSIINSGLNTGPAVPPRLYGLFVQKPDRCYEGGDFYRMRSSVSGGEFNSPTLQTDDFKGLVLVTVIMIGGL